MEIIVCMTIDVVEASIGLLVRCMMQSVQTVDRTLRFHSNLQKTDLFTAGIATRKEDHLDIDLLMVQYSNVLTR